MLRTKTTRDFLRCPDVAAPLLFWLAVGTFYLGALYGIHIGFPADVQARHRFYPASWGYDDVTPERLAESLYRGNDPTVPDSEWGVSDRPPLQSGLFLIVRPLSLWTGLGVPEHYEAAALGFQCCWVPALWALARISGLSSSHALRTLALLAFTGFFVLNSVYVWPKMLSGSFGLLAAVPYVSQGRPRSTWDYGLVGIAAGLGWLAHGGAAFTLLALAVLYLLPPRPDWREIATGLSAFLALAVPWALYQKFYDPPGDKLIKAHIAGQISREQSPEESVFSVLAKAYARLTPTQVVAHKVENVKSVLGPPPPSTIAGWRRAEFDHLAYAFGPLSLGWPLLLLPSRRCFRPWLAVGVFSVVLNVLLLYGPGSAHPRHGSYAGYLALLGATAGALALLPDLVFMLLLVVQALWCAVVWLVSPAVDLGATPDLSMILAGLCGLLLLLLVIFQLDTSSSYPIKVTGTEPPELFKHGGERSEHHVLNT
jgi:hypothetical protein